MFGKKSSSEREEQETDSKCPKCQGNMIPHNSKGVVLTEGIMKYKKTHAIACKECGFIEFYLNLK